MEGRLVIRNSNYTNSYVKTRDGETPVKIDTRVNKCFHNDIVFIDSGAIKDYKECSDYRCKMLAGILDITSIKRYGFTKKGTPIYMWRAFEREIPPFYVASNIRKKLRPPFRNVYCIIRYKNWSRDRPEGTAIKILGEVSDKKATIEYMRYCYNLYTKIYRFPRGFTMPDTTSYITDLPEDVSIIFSVDPPGTLDIDDAFSITLQDGLYDIGIYIADPTRVIDVLEGLGCEGLLQWICKRGTTLYTTEGNYPMMPEEISTGAASLLQGEQRGALSIHLRFSKSGVQQPEIGIRHSVVTNSRAYTYKEVDDIVAKGKTGKPVYTLYQISKKIASKNVPSLVHPTGDWNSHKMVETMMVVANMCVADFLHEHASELYISRSHTGLNNKIRDVPADIIDKVRVLNTSAAKYTVTHGSHKGLGVERYTHYTSPIRRIVDLYTHYLLKHVVFGHTIPDCIKHLPRELDYVNERVKQSKRFTLANNRLIIYDTLHLELDGYDTVEAYVVDMSENWLKVYIPKYNMVLGHHIIHRNISKIYLFYLDYDSNGNIYRQRIEAEDDGSNNMVFVLYKRYQIKLYAISADCVRDRIRFEFLDE